MTTQLARLILPDYALTEGSRKVLEGQFTPEQLSAYNNASYNIYFLPNRPSRYEQGITLDGYQIDTFEYVFVDCDLKDGVYKSKEDFLNFLSEFPLMPTKVVDSGNGIHAYWSVCDLDAMSFLRLQRRLMRYFKTDEAVVKIFQLMRLPGYLNTKKADDLKPCVEIISADLTHTCEQLSSVLPAISFADETYCKQHFEKTYRLKSETKVDTKLPLKFSQLLAKSSEVKEIWTSEHSDRSKADWRLAHLLFAHGLSKDEAMSVLVNSPKAMQRAPAHQVAYAENIVDKIWTYEIEADKSALNLSKSVLEILQGGAPLKGTRFACHRYLDATAHGFRLGQVIGLVAGSGVGKTAVALNMFLGFVQNNPDYDHFFVPLEQPANEIAERWQSICGANTHLHSKVHVISNYADDGSFRHLSFDEIKDYILKYQRVTGRKAGCVVLDHIGALKKQGKNGENQDLMTICHSMKAFAVQTNTLLVMQSQAPREKAGIGDLELNKDAAYGTVFFESYCDYLIAVWQPLKRCYMEEGCPTVTAFKFCKIRHKNQKKDDIQEDSRHMLYFDSDTGLLRHLTEADGDISFWNKRATNKRKSDPKTEVLEYDAMKWLKKEEVV